MVDASAYYDAFVKAALQAQHSIYILGWDLDSRVDLWPDERHGAPPRQLGPFLNWLAGQRPNLNIYLLAWDFSFIYAGERQIAPFSGLGHRLHRRVHFSFDGRHPAGASHHQKVAVIDDAIAFAGGLDFAVRRWDTPRHDLNDARRVDPAGRPYLPFHDVQIAVSGDAARAFGELARERWRRAHGVAPEPPALAGPLWPEGVAADVIDTEVAIARTEPGIAGRSPVREVERLHLDAIAAARACIYIENQYLTSAILGAALCEALRRPDGPEVIAVLPGKVSSFIEHATMDLARERTLRRLRDADLHGRLSIYHPVVSSGGLSAPVSVHSKLLIVDDRLLRIGSSNLSNRSMGFDTECDVVLESLGRDNVVRAIRGLRNRLLGEHLGVAPEIVESASQGRQLREAIEMLRGGEHTLEPIEIGTESWKERLLSDRPLFDLPAPLDPEELLVDLVPPEAAERRRPRLVRLAILASAAVALAAAWQFTELGRIVDAAALERAFSTARDTWWAPLAAVAAYVVGGLVMFPVTLLIVQTGATFGPLLGSILALAGSLASAAVGYGIGRAVGREALERFAGRRANDISLRLAEHGTMAVIAVRVLPVAPFSLVNLVAGTTHIRFSDYLKGTLVGMGPGVLAMTLLGDRLAAALRSPEWTTLLLLVLVAATLLLISWVLIRRIE